MQFFNTVELNVTFYRLVQDRTFHNWYAKTPKNFRFGVKGSRFITHIKRLKNIEDSLTLFINKAACLKDKLASVLWQLPPSYKKDLKRLEIFLRLLDKTGLRQVFEFRNESWFDEEVYALLRKYNACLCIAHSAGRFPCIKVTTADFVYLRFHGASDALYSSDYSDRELKVWADFVRIHKRRDILVFFNNDSSGFAVKNALRFKDMLIDYK